MSPAAALNRKYDLLAKSGTCPPYLLDVLTLLVAHANDTELFKHELRSAPFGNAIPPRATELRAVTVAESVDSTECEKESQPSQANVARASEALLQAHAADLKVINDVALATSSKALRQLKESTSADMLAFRDGVVRKTIDQTRDELDSLRMEWLASLDGEVARLKAELHRAQLAAEGDVHRAAGACGDLAQRAFGLLSVQPLLDAHRAIGESALCAGRLAALEQRAATRAEAEALGRRLGDVERAVAKIGDRDAGGRASPPPHSPKPQMRQTSAERQSTKVSPPQTASRADTAGATPLGLHVRDGGDEVEGIIVADVVPHSLADVFQITPGCIISRVGRTNVCTCAEFAQAVHLAGSVVRLTVYDPQIARVSIVTVRR